MTTRIVALGLSFVAACTPATGPAIAAGGAALVQCVSGEIAKGDDTFEGIAAACGASTIAEVVGVVETLSVANPTASDAGVASPTLAALVHHKAKK